MKLRRAIGIAVVFLGACGAPALKTPLVRVDGSPRESTAPVCKNFPADYQTGYLLDPATEAEREAASVAIALSGEFVAPMTIATSLQHDLQLIRKVYGNTVSSTTRRFPSNQATTDQLYASVLTSYAPQVSDGTYPNWQCTNEILGLTSVHYYGESIYPDTELAPVVDFGLNFTRSYHGDLLAAFYQNLPGFTRVMVNRSSSVGSPPSMGFGSVAGGTGYLFSIGYQCMDFCNNAEYDYFVVSGNEVAYKGKWISGTPLPEWWAEAQSVVDDYQRRLSTQADRNVCVCGVRPTFRY